MDKYKATGERQSRVVFYMQDVDRRKIDNGGGGGGGAHIHIFVFCRIILSFEIEI